MRANWLITATIVAALGFSALAREAPAFSDDSQAADSAGGPVVVGTIRGAIGPVAKDYVNRVLGAAGGLSAQCVVFEMDTPGGLDASMRSIIKDIFASPVPVVIFVYPSGARAASAGAIISLAAHVVAMAPSTNIGAAHPVPLGESDMDDEMAEKITNDAAAYARGLATKRGRDVEWAENIVRESISSTAEEVLELGVIDLIVNSVEELLEEIDGLVIDMDGREVELKTAEATVTRVDPSLRERFLARISDPNIAYLLMLLGIFGIFFELQNPGAIFPGVIGAIAILLAFFALQLLPVNLAGVALILLAIIMFILEVKVPSGGLLTIGGIVAMVIGSIMFIDSPLPFMRVSLKVIVPAVIFTAAFFIFAVGMALRAQKRKVTTGGKGLVGEIGVAKTEIGAQGSVFVHGEFWNAYSDDRIPQGSKVKVVNVEGLTLKVQAFTTDKEVV